LTNTEAQQNHWSEPRAAMNAQTEFEALLALPVVAQFWRWPIKPHA
jgi:hypothetical protein